MTYEDLGTNNHDCSFYQFCLVNDCMEILDRWDYDKNKEDPKDITLMTGKYWFKCENGIHDSELKNLESIRRYKKVTKCSICNSFGYYCEKYHRQDLLDRWDYDLNKCTPYNISHGSSKKYYFKCPKGIHSSEAKIINALIREPATGKCNQCNSFAQWGIDNLGGDFLDKYWSDKNDISPWKITPTSNRKIWIKCPDVSYHQDYQTCSYDFSHLGNRCPYCSHHKIDKRDSLGALYPKIFESWCEKKTTPYDYSPFSNKTKLFYCKKHGYYKRTIYNHVACDMICPKCRKQMTESKLEKKVREYLETLGYTILHEENCTISPINVRTGRKFRYDNEIKELHALIEVNGQQHYYKHGFFHHDNQTEEQAYKLRKEYDGYKIKYAKEHGYSITTIPFWEDDKKETWKKHINSFIDKIKNNQVEKA